MYFHKKNMYRNSTHNRNNNASLIKPKSCLRTKKSTIVKENKYRLKHKQLNSKLRNQVTFILPPDLYASLYKPKLNTNTVLQQPAFVKSKLVQDWVVSQRIYIESRKARMQNRAPGSEYGSPVLKTPVMNHLPLMESDVWSASDLYMRQNWQFNTSSGFLTVQHAYQDRQQPWQSSIILEDETSRSQSQSKVRFLANAFVYTNEDHGRLQHGNVSDAKFQNPSIIMSQFSPTATHVSHHVPLLPIATMDKPVLNTALVSQPTNHDTSHTTTLPIVHSQHDVSLNELLDHPTCRMQESPLANRSRKQLHPHQMIDTKTKYGPPDSFQRVISRENDTNICVLKQSKSNQATNLKHADRTACSGSISGKPIDLHTSPKPSSYYDKRASAFPEPKLLQPCQSLNDEHSLALSFLDSSQPQLSAIAKHMLASSKAHVEPNAEFSHSLPQSHTLYSGDSVGSCLKCHRHPWIPQTIDMHHLRQTITTRIPDPIHSVLSDDLSELCRTWPTWCSRS